VKQPLTRAPAAEDRQLEDLEIAVDVLETALAQPVALLLDRSQDIGGLIRPMHELVGLLTSSVISSPHPFDKLRAGSDPLPEGERTFG